MPSKLRRDFTAQFAEPIAGAVVISFSFVEQLKNFSKHQDKLFKIEKITETDLAALINYQGTVALTESRAKEGMHKIWRK